MATLSNPTWKEKEEYTDFKIRFKHLQIYINFLSKNQGNKRIASHIALAISSVNEL